MAYERILQRIGFIENKLDLIIEWKPKKKEIYLNDLQLQAAIERQVQNIIEVIIQICVQLIKHFNLGLPRSEDSIIELLRSKLKNYALIKELKKFRNILVHQYITFDSEKIFDFLPQFIQDTRIIVEEFKTIIK